MKIRSYLLLFALALLVPMTVFAVLAVWAVDRRQRTVLERGGVETARALMSAVDRELARSITTLQVLATARSLERDDLVTFHDEARRVLTSQRDWQALILISPDGELRMDTTFPFGASLPPIRERFSFEAVLRTGQPAIGPVTYGLIARRSLVAIRVPVVRDGRLVYVLTGVHELGTFQDILTQQQIPPEWAGGIFDSYRTVVARTRSPEQVVGEPMAPGLSRLLDTRPEGWASTTSRDGTPVYTAFSRSPTTQWGVALGIPSAAVDAPLRRSMLALTGGALVVGLGAIGASVLVGRRMAQPIVALSTAAGALDPHDDASLDPSTRGPAEVAIVARALARAAGEQRRIETERVGLLTMAEEARVAAERTAERLRRLQTVTDTALARLEIERLPGELLERVRVAVEADTATLLGLDEAHRELVVLATVGLREEIEPHFRVPVGQGFAGTVAVRREPVMVDPRAAESPILSPFLRDRLQSLLGVPLLLGDQLVGVIHVGSTHARAFTSDQVELLQMVADRLALALRQMRLHAVERTAREEAEAANRAKDEFLAMLGHELRNPLGAIAGATRVLDLLEDRSDEHGSDQTGQARAIIARQVNHLTRLVDDLLDVARVTTGKIHLQRGPVNAADIVTASVTALTAANRLDRHDLRVHVKPAWVDGDRARLEQVVTNLLLNAIRFTPSDGRIGVNLTVENDEAVIRVEDSGIGIPATLLPRIFDLFVQGDRGPYRPQGGLGIGLTLVQRLVALHGGTIEAASEGPGRGSVFTVRLPCVVSPTDESMPPSISPMTVTPRRIVLIEDNRDVRNGLRTVLELSGHEVHDAEDGPTGIAMALRLQPDVVLVDIGLPGLDGYHVAREIRSAAKGHSMLLVAITGYGRPEDRRRGEEAGFDSYLVKPVDAQRLAEVFSKVRDAHPA
jgi:signal transduction histidine kinase/ActR/RegA family two-component response regulator